MKKAGLVPAFFYLWASSIFFRNSCYSGFVMLKEYTVEAAVDFLLNKGREKIDWEDRDLLANIRSKTWWDSSKTPPKITPRQQQRVKDILTKYLLLLKTLDWPVENLYDPVWECEVVECSFDWIIDYDRDTNEYLVQYYYSPYITDLLSNVGDCVSFTDTIKRDAEKNLWRIKAGVQGSRLVSKLLEISTKWFCPPTLQLQIKKAVREGWTVPTVSYLNGEWHIKNASPSLVTCFNEIVQKDMDNVQTVFELSDLGVEFAPNVVNLLRTHLTKNQARWLCDQNPQVDETELPELVRLIEQVGRWPVVEERNWSSVDYILKDYVRENTDWRIIKNVEPTPSDVPILHLYSNTDDESTSYGEYMPNLNTTARLPWVIKLGKVETDIYELWINTNSVNYTKSIKVTQSYAEVHRSS